jgi:hypothetical protein
MMSDTRIFQFVCFQTLLAREAFLTRWEPFAASFLERGIERIVLADRDASSDGFAFISRNEWPEDRFRAAFLGQLPSDAGGGGVLAVQGGAFRVAFSAERESRAGPGTADKVVALVGVVPDALALTVDELRSLAVEHANGAEWMVFARDRTTRGGRFDAVLEVYASPGESTSRMRRNRVPTGERSSGSGEPCPHDVRAACAATLSAVKTTSVFRVAKASGRHSPPKRASTLSRGEPFASISSTSAVARSSLVGPATASSTSSNLCRAVP